MAPGRESGADQELLEYMRNCQGKQDPDWKSIALHQERNLVLANQQIQSMEEEMAGLKSELAKSQAMEAQLAREKVRITEAGKS